MWSASRPGRFASPRKYPLIRRMGGGHRFSGSFGSENNFFFPAGNRTKISRSHAVSYCLRCSTQALCIYSLLDETCATVAVSVNRAVSGGQFPSEDIATLTHSLTTLLSLWPTPAASTYTKSFDGKPVAGSMPFTVSLQHRRMPTSCFGIEHTDSDLISSYLTASVV